MKQPKGFSITPFKDTTIARLYKTNIVVINHTTKTAELNTGGWYTVHTKKCMNLILNNLGYSIKQKSGQWYISNKDYDDLYEYTDGMKIAI
jgi:hypothetical protein